MELTSNIHVRKVLLVKKNFKLLLVAHTHLHGLSLFPASVEIKGQPTSGFIPQSLFTFCWSPGFLLAWIYPTTCARLAAQ